MSSFPEITTPRLILTKPSYEDIPSIMAYAGNKKIADTTLNIPHPYEEKDAIYWINNANQGFENKTQYTFGVRLKATVEFIGGIGLILNKRFNHAELGYWIAEAFWNHGYATEAVGGMIAFGFDQLDLHKIYATHLVGNPASGKVMINNGMTKEGELIDHVKKGDAYHSLIQYGITKREYENPD